MGTITPSYNANCELIRIRLIYVSSVVVFRNVDHKPLNFRVVLKTLLKISEGSFFVKIGCSLA